jgi:hypothetical protein
MHYLSNLLARTVVLVAGCLLLAGCTIPAGWLATVDGLELEILSVQYHTHEHYESRQASETSSDQSSDQPDSKYAVDGK